jgi:UDP-N-acetylglucosamine 2-epimerase (non-hydrolysing)
MTNLLLVFGTRPEAIKLFPVARAAADRRLQTRICVTAQHREMLDQVLTAVSIRPDWDLNLMAPGQTLCQSTARIVSALEPVLQEAKPDMVVVQGDTTTTFAAALAAFYNRIPVAHVEAGLRTGDPWQPFPEEANRVLTSRLSDLHFAATERARMALEAEGVSRERIFVTGNTGIDALRHIIDGFDSGTIEAPPWPELDTRKRLLVVTAHRRESFGAGFQNICEALLALSRRGDVEIALPVHPNPNVQASLQMLRGQPGIVLLPPLDYISFVALMRRAFLLLTDSGGIQEEAPSLGKPVLVLRDKTERPEAVDSGTARLVGPHTGRIVAAATQLLDDASAYSAMSRAHNPYGDGRAAGRIVSAIEAFIDRKKSS